MIQFTRRLVYFCLWVFLSQIEVTFAELSHLELKGVHEWINPEYSFLSPINGSLLIGTDTLAHRRFYGNYGPKKSGFDCMENASRIHQILVERDDCPQDYTAELIQRLFPSQDGANFVANQVESDPVSHLKPGTIGSVLAKLTEVQDRDLEDPVQEERLKLSLMKLFMGSFDERQYLKVSRKELYQRLNTTTVSIEDRTNVRTQLDVIERILKELEAPDAPQASKAPEVSEQTPGELSKRGKPKDFGSFAELIIHSLKEARIAPVKYPRYFVEQSFLAFLWKRGTKADLISYYQGLYKINPKLLKNSSILTDPELQERFLHDRYSSPDYIVEALSEDPATESKYLIQYPEKLAFFIQQEYLSSDHFLPRLISFGNANHSSLGNVQYPDCGETSVRNFFNIILYSNKGGEGRFELDRIKHLPNVYPKLIEFYRRNSDPSLAMKDEVRHEWSEVVSGHAGVEYLKGNGQCEINAGIDNALSIIDRLLFNESDQHRGPIVSARDRESKLDELCKVVSGADFNLQWSPIGMDRSSVNEKNTGIELVFSINSKPLFSWEFRQRHFAVKALPESKKSWKDRVAPLLRKLAPENHELAHTAILTGFVSESSLLVDEEANSAEENPIYFENLLYSLPLGTHDGKIHAFQLVVAHPQAKEMKDLARRLQMRLPANDSDTQRKLHMFLVAYDYPIGEPPPHALGRPNAMYRRIPSEEMIRIFGPTVAKSMGKSWERNFPENGHSVIFGDLFQIDSGRPREADYETAIKTCIGLNPESTQKAVTDAVERRAHLLRTRSMKPPTNFSSREYRGEYQRQNVDFLAKNPIPGCFLLSTVEWEILRHDLSGLGGAFIPQYLPHLSTAATWLLGDLKYGEATLAWSARYLQKDIRHLSAFRCVCQKPQSSGD